MDGIWIDQQGIFMIEFLFGFLFGYLVGIFINYIITKIDKDIKNGRR
jgi:NhaP-type Na+/H+ or K+/H+ antiporter